MLTSQFLLATIKETPADAELISHQLMLRAGLIRKLASGLYTWLPMGLRVLKKVENIVRAEMNNAGALEILMPAIQPAELWVESGRWNKYGKELLKIKDRHDREFCYGPTHEEVVTTLMRNELNSYKQLPINLYQIQTKFRDEIRPRFGVMRAREFIMKDAYSFHVNSDSLKETYQIMHDTYSAIFTRLGLQFRAVLADTGQIGGAFSHEFQVLAQSGEDVIAYSDSSDYAANIERAESGVAANSDVNANGSVGVFNGVNGSESDRVFSTIKKIPTPNIKTIQALSDKLNIAPSAGVKTLIVHGTENKLIALIIRGDHELNPIKAEKLSLVAKPLTMASPEDIKNTLGCGIGSLGPVNLKIQYIVDRDAATLTNFACGANEDDFHFVNVNWGRDAQCEIIADLRMVVEGDLSPDGKGKLKFARGIEVGHIFQLGDTYSKSMNLTVLNEEGKSLHPQMGCYGIGISRIVAAAIEQNHDEKGIIWPKAMAPFQVVIVPMQMQKSYRVRDLAMKIYKELKSLNIEVLLDDRTERPGVMFADMDLIGIPHRIVIGERGIDAGIVEYKHRKNNTVDNIAIDNIVAFIKERTKKIMNMRG